MGGPSVTAREIELEESATGQEALTDREVEVFGRALEKGYGEPYDAYRVGVRVGVRATLAAAADENTTDGYHSFKELYEYRLLYNAALFNEWAMLAEESRMDWADMDVHKSRRHSDGEECFGGGWFVVVARLPTNEGYEQISNHYRLSDWHLFRVPERDRAAEWDGHTPADVEARLRAFLIGGGGQ
jgi:hypothetical protein